MFMQKAMCATRSAGNVFRVNFSKAFVGSSVVVFFLMLVGWILTAAITVISYVRSR